MNKLSLATLSLVFAAFALPGLAQAQESTTEMRPYVSLNYDQVFADRLRATDSSGPGFSMSFGAPINKYWGVEVGGFDDQLRAESGVSTRNNHWSTYGANLDAMFFFSRNSGFSPYTVLSVGAIHSVENGAAQATNPFGAAGAGFFKFFSVGDYDLGIRGDVRERWSGTRGTVGGTGSFSALHDTVVKVGLVLPLGRRAVAASESVSTGARVDACTLDADGDGVPDCRDKCPDTPRGMKVDANGCPVDANRTFEDVHFAFDKSDLTDYAKAILDNAANVINGLSQKYPKLEVEVSGHTDWIGSEGYNQGLSERRANAVKKYLSRKGVDPEHVQTHAYGETKPIAPNTTAEGRALNRRAEIKTHE
ncbi:MAG: OmpA family protein [Stenotrophobium sp.]